MAPCCCPLSFSQYPSNTDTMYAGYNWWYLMSGVATVNSLSMYIDSARIGVKMGVCVHLTECCCCCAHVG